MILFPSGEAHRLEKVPTFGASLSHVGQQTLRFKNDLPRPGLRCMCVSVCLCVCVGVYVCASGNGVYDGIRYNGLKKMYVPISGNSVFGI